MAAQVKRPLLVLVGLLLAGYLALATLVCLRTAWLPDPWRAAEAYLRALQQRDAVGIYLYSSMLGPHLAGMMADGGMAEEQRRLLWAKDFVRWKSEFERGAQAMDAVRRERSLLRPEATLEPVRDAADYKVEEGHGEESELVSYGDRQGALVQTLWRLSYPRPEKAPAVSLLDNVESERTRRIRRVTVRVEVRRRPDVRGPRAWLMDWNWLDELAPAVPFRELLSPLHPSEVWMAQVHFAVDKLTLETF